MFLIEYHFVKSGPSPKTSLCSADLFLNIHVLILNSGCNETTITATNLFKQPAKHSKHCKKANHNKPRTLKSDRTDSNAQLHPLIFVIADTFFAELIKN